MKANMNGLIRSSFILSSSQYFSVIIAIRTTTITSKSLVTAAVSSFNNSYNKIHEPEKVSYIQQNFPKKSINENKKRTAIQP